MKKRKKIRGEKREMHSLFSLRSVLFGTYKFSTMVKRIIAFKGKWVFKEKINRFLLKLYFHLTNSKVGF